MFADGDGVTHNRLLTKDDRWWSPRPRIADDALFRVHDFHRYRPYLDQHVALVSIGIEHRPITLEVTGLLGRVVYQQGNAVDGYVRLVLSIKIIKRHSRMTADFGHFSAERIGPQPHDHFFVRRERVHGPGLGAA